MSEEHRPENSDIRRQQTYYLIGIGAGLALVLMTIFYVISDGREPPQKTTSQQTMASPIDKISTQNVWLQHAQNKLKDVEKQTHDLHEVVQNIKKQQDGTVNIEQNPQFLALQQQVAILQKSLDSKGVETTQKQRTLSSLPQENYSPGHELSGTQAPGIDNDELHLLPSKFNKPIKNSESFVPAGTFAEAVMLGSADASAGVTSQANPSPMLFRIVARGTLPNHHKSHLKDCMVTAAVVGDISSERGLIRLERLSCVFPNGEVVEQPVEGTIFAMDAKNGVRGTPVWREGRLLQRAALAGTLSGLANGVSQRYVTNSISSLGNVQTVQGGDILKHGMASGASNAMEKLADYNIQRAEQYHPIIQISAGQSVDVVFLKGFFLDGRDHREEHAAHDEPRELFPNVNAQANTGLTISESELKKIKQHEESLNSN